MFILSIALILHAMNTKKKKLQLLDTLTGERYNDHSNSST
jgi:hypothetical protein